MSWRPPSIEKGPGLESGRCLTAARSAAGRWELLQTIAAQKLAAEREAYIRNRPLLTKLKHALLGAYNGWRCGP